MKKYELVFIQGNYSHVDFESDSYEQCVEVKDEMQVTMFLLGERHFDYIIRETKEEE